MLPLCFALLLAAGTAVSSVAVARANAVIAARSEAAIASGSPTKMLVTFKVSEQQVTAQAGAISQSTAATTASPTAIHIAARQQVNTAVKARVLGPAAASAGGAGSRTVEEAASTAAPAVGSGVVGSVRVVRDFSHLPITLISIGSSAELAQLRANPEVLSVTADGMVRPMAMNGLSFIGQPDVQAQGYVGTGTIAVIDTGKPPIHHCCKCSVNRAGRLISSMYN